MNQIQQKGQIYIIKNHINSKVYIGQSLKYRKNCKIDGYQKRMKEHIYSARTKPTYHMDRCIKELGIENFYIELLEECELEELDNKEIYYISKYSSLHPNGYNIVLGNPHSACNPEHTSNALKKYYNDTAIKLKHSQVHMNKFNELDNSKTVTHIDIKPIFENSKPKIVYMYISYNDSSSYRRRYGGIHISFEDAYNRCLEDSKSLVSTDAITDYVINNSDIVKSRDYEEVQKVKMVYQKMRSLDLVAVIINTTNSKRRVVFGGKTIPYNIAYTRALSFIKNLNVLKENIEIDSKVIATLSN